MLEAEQVRAGDQEKQSHINMKTAIFRKNSLKPSSM
jgi:hypothetical protein